MERPESFDSLSTNQGLFKVDRVGHCQFRRSGRWKRPIVFTVRSSVNLQQLDLQAMRSMTAVLGGRWSQKVGMTRIGLQQSAFWQGQKGQPAPLRSGNLGFHGSLFYRFDDEDWDIWSSFRERILEPAVPPFRIVLVVARKQLEPLIHVAFNISVMESEVVVNECTMKLVSGEGAAHTGTAGVEVARLKTAIRLDPYDAGGPRQVLAASWGLLSIRMSAFGQGRDGSPVVIASFACEPPSPHEKYLRGTMSSLQAGTPARE